MKFTFFILIILTSFLSHAREIDRTVYTLGKELILKPTKTFVDTEGNMFREVDLGLFSYTYEVDEDMVYEPMNTECLTNVCKFTYIIVDNPEQNQSPTVHIAYGFYPNHRILVDKKELVQEEVDTVPFDNVILYEVPEDKNCKSHCVNDFVWRGDKNNKDLEFYKYLTSDFEPEKFNLRPPFDPNLGQIVAKLNNGYYLYAFKPALEDEHQQYSIEFVINKKDGFMLVK